MRINKFMKIFKYILILVVLGVAVYFIFQSKIFKNGDTVVDGDKLGIELCFAKFTPPNSNSLYDKYTLRLKMTGEEAVGELRLVPGEKDSKVGLFEGTVSAVDKQMMARTASLWWDTFAEGMNVKEELKIVFGEGIANIGFGEMVDRGDGVYIYKDPTSIAYNLELTDMSCEDLTVRENVEKYLRGNIVTLSPVQASMGGTWYVLSMTIDLPKKSGAVVYEDGHTEERRNFTYTINSNQEVESLKIE